MTEGLPPSDQRIADTIAVLRKERNGISKGGGWCKDRDRFELNCAIERLQEILRRREILRSA